MSHTGQASCSIQGARQETLDEALEHLCAMWGATLRAKGEQVHQWGGVRLAARGSVVAGLPCAYRGTDVDVHIEKGQIHIVGDANSNDRVKAEVEKAYKAAAYQRTLRARGMRTRLEVDPKKRQYRLQAITS